MAEKKDLRIGIRLPSKDVEILHTLAARFDVSISHLVRYAVRKQIVNAEKPPTATDLFGG